MKPRRSLAIVEAMTVKTRDKITPDELDELESIAGKMALLALQLEPLLDRASELQGRVWWDESAEPWPMASMVAHDAKETLCRLITARRFS